MTIQEVNGKWVLLVTLDILRNWWGSVQETWSWDSSKRKKETWIVAKYAPPGNYVSQFIKNVGIRKPRGKTN